MADELNKQALPIHHTKPYKITISKIMALHGTLVCDCNMNKWQVGDKNDIF